MSAPRRFLVDAARFGWTDGVAVSGHNRLPTNGDVAKWATPAAGDETELVVARLQHATCALMRDELAKRNWTVARAAEETGVRPETLRRKLTGELPAGLGEYLSWEEKLRCGLLRPLGNVRGWLYESL